VYLHVLKNSLARPAVAGTPFEVASESMAGPLFYGFSADAVAAAKVIADFAKSNDKLVIIGGAYAGKALDANGVKALAAIPSREVLISQVAGLLKSPIQRFAAVLAALVEKSAPAAEAVVEVAPAAEAPAAA
jgi:large subunit ribosomal protein L10